MVDNEKDFKKSTFATETATPAKSTTVVEEPKTAEELRQEKQREETQAFLDVQAGQRAAMAAETKAKEEREAKVKKK
jgi:hypothetical protein